MNNGKTQDFYWKVEEVGRAGKTATSFVHRDSLRWRQSCDWFIEMLEFANYYKLVLNIDTEDNFFIQGLYNSVPSLYQKYLLCSVLPLNSSWENA